MNMIIFLSVISEPSTFLQRFHQPKFCCHICTVLYHVQDSCSCQSHSKKHFCLFTYYLHYILRL